MPATRVYTQMDAQSTITSCLFCGRETDADAITCGRYGCTPSLTRVLDAIGEDNLYLHTTHKGRMQLYHDVHGTPTRDELVWSDSTDERTIALLERLGVDTR